MTDPTKLRTAEDVNRYRLALVAPDQAFFASEQKWGVGRLERLCSQQTLASYQRGWEAYRRALDDGDAEAIEAIGPKMIAALAWMDQEATAAGHQPLAPDTWEIDRGNGNVIVVVRTGAEASAVMRAANQADGQSYETTLPPDIATTIRSQHEGRSLTVLTMREVARLLDIVEGKVSGVPWEGSPAHSGVQMDEGAAADIVRRGYPLSEPTAVETPKTVALNF
jgi:hypothetical protein